MNKTKTRVNQTTKTPPTPAPLTDDECKRIVESIKRISSSAKALKSAGLSKRALLVLLRDATNLPMGDINLVLNAATELSSWCLAQPKKKDP